MKLLAFVDTHNSLKSLKEIKKKSKQADMIVCAGDLTIFENGLTYMLAELNRLKKPVLIIDGNHESVNDMKKACSLFKNINFIHNKVYKKDGFVFFGYGGGGFSMVNKDFERSAKNHEKELKEKIILITHAPPYGTNIDKIHGQYAGSRSITKFIKKFRPILAISGHLHENAGKKGAIGKTKIINPGPFGVIVKI